MSVFTDSEPTGLSLLAAGKRSGLERRQHQRANWGPGTDWVVLAYLDERDRKRCWTRHWVVAACTESVMCLRPRRNLRTRPNPLTTYHVSMRRRFELLWDKLLHIGHCPFRGCRLLRYWRSRRTRPCYCKSVASDLLPLYLIRTELVDRRQCIAALAWW